MLNKTPFWFRQSSRLWLVLRKSTMRSPPILRHCKLLPSRREMFHLNTFKSSLMHSQGALASCIGLLCGWVYLSEVFSSIFSCESAWKLRTALSTVLKLRRRVWESTLKTLHLWKCALFWKKISRSSLTRNPIDFLASWLKWMMNNESTLWMLQFYPGNSMPRWFLRNSPEVSGE